MTTSTDTMWTNTLFGAQAFNAQHVFDPQYDSNTTLTLGNIDNLHNTDIHDIWHIDNFRNCLLQDVMQMMVSSREDYFGGEYDFPIEVYIRMRPALRLATRLLDRARYALIHIAHSPIVHDRSGLRFEGDLVVTPEMEMAFDRMLEEVTQRVMFFHYPFDSTTHPFLGLTAINPRAAQVHLWYVSAVADGFFRAFNDPNWYDLPFHHQDSTSVAFACILVHELAHLIFRHSRLELIVEYKHRFGVEPAEPYLFDGDSGAELGAAVERYLFGGRLMLPTPTSSQVDSIPPPAFDGSLGLSIILDQPYAGCPDREVENYTNKVWFLHPKTLYLLMHSSTFTSIDYSSQDFQGWPHRAALWFGLSRTPIITPLQQGTDGVEGKERRDAILANSRNDTHTGLDDDGFHVDLAAWWRRKDIHSKLLHQELRYEPIDASGCSVWMYYPRASS